MNDPYGQLMPQVIRLAEALPAGTLQTLASAIANCPAQGWEQLRLRASQIVPQLHLRSLVLDMLTAWQQQMPGVQPAEVALMLRTAAVTAHSVRAAQTVELVWTGPLVAGPAMRRTDQALLQVINAAQQSLLIVSFAVYKISAIAAAIVRAGERGVTIRICVEAPEPSGQKLAHDTIKALGIAVAQRAAIYVWPSDKRPTDESGKAGVLHAKCAVADSHLLFISSANLTDNAMTLNMELGVLVQSHTHASRVEAQFEHMIAQGVLWRMPADT
jgi:phosphatidylserine/phosphatidylglycerophosphate/cardiolipin synthase-like enzyme